MDKLKIKPLKGIHDYFLNNIYLLNYIEKSFRDIISLFSFEEIRLPILERKELFNKCINKDYEIFSKEMYSLKDNNNIILGLKPEGTVSCLRAYIQNKLYLNNFLNKFWYIGPMFRYENTQKGRFRQFYQIGLELYGSLNIGMDIELLLIIKYFFKKLNIYNFLYLEINTIGSFCDRKKYINFIKNNYNKIILNKLSINKNINYFKLIDKKDKKFLDILNNIPKFRKFINKKSLNNFYNICRKLDCLNIKYKINYNLVRGINYYNDFVFEWKIKKKYIYGSNNTICAGGRYNSLSKNISTLSIPSIGCAIGLERLIIFLKENNIKNIVNKNIDIYIISSYNNKSILLGMLIFKRILNSNLNNLKIYNDHKLYNNLSNILKKILKNNVRILIIIDKKEICGNYITIKDLYYNKQKKVNFFCLIKTINNFLKL